MNKAKRTELTQRFFNTFTNRAMTSRTDVATQMTDAVNLAFQFKAYDILEERRVEVYVYKTVLMVQIAKLKAGENLSDIRQFVLGQDNFNHVILECTEFFAKNID